MARDTYKYHFKKGNKILHTELQMISKGVKMNTNENMGQMVT